MQELGEALGYLLKRWPREELIAGLTFMFGF
jgi:hypothetical protein